MVAKTTCEAKKENSISFVDLYDEDVEVEDEFEVIEVSPNRYKTTFHVPQ